MVSLKGRSFLKLLDYTAEEIEYLLDLASKLKKEKKNGIPHRICEGKNVALIFEKTSTRTRCAFEVACRDLGAGVTYLDPTGSQIGKKESIADTARVLGRMFDGIEYRGFGQEIVEDLSKYAGVPVWNGLTDEFHPTQILADFLTIREHFGKLKGINLVYMGDARFNMGNSLLVGSAIMGVNFTVCAPKEYFPSSELRDAAEKLAKESGAILKYTENPAEAVANADAIYTDVWVSMGEPDSVWKERIEALMPYQVNERLMSMAKPETVFMHCLPAYHDLNTAVARAVNEKFGLTELEVTDAVFESKNSIVFDEAENRMHTIKAVVAATLV
ncbi:MAG: ornithine carbamoyltransferase [Clostridia bacterium]|nr:ornithine carbamoyltransferase [Clostridia bacterium]